MNHFITSNILIVPLGDLIAEALGNFIRLIFISIIEQDYKLLSSVAGTDVISPQVFTDDRADGLYYFVAGLMSVGIIDVFEKIDIRHNNRQFSVFVVKMLDSLC